MIWDFLIWLEGTDISTWAREGDFIVPGFATFYALLGIHSVGMAVVVGICLMISSRLFGFQLSMSVQRANELMGFAWWGFYVNLFSGIILYVAQPVRELMTVLFWVKIIVIVFAVITMRVIQKGLNSLETIPNPNGTGTVEVVPLGLRVSAFVLDIFWLAAIVSGRLIGYTQPPPGLNY